jgi:hypothetical protein
MRITHRRRWALLGAAFGAGVAAVVVSAVALFAGAGVAASAVKPVNTQPPTISGTPQQGKTLTGDKGNWNNSPSDYNLYWTRCNQNGGNCSNISGAHEKTYTLGSADVGRTLRFKVIAKNQDGSTTAVSVPTAVITAAPTPPPPPSDGCPPGGNPDQVANITAPAGLILDTLQSDPQVVGNSTQTLVVKFHVTSTCGGPVQGALVYATATPFNQFAIPPEVPTGADGWAVLTFTRLSGFPVSSKQQLLAMFVRARKPGENLLVGIAARRLVSLRVNLHS